MKKRVHAIVLVIAMIFSMFGSVTFNVEEAKADTTVKIKFHYSREDKNYEGWNLWTWSDKNQPLTFDEKEENVQIEKDNLTNQIEDDFGTLITVEQKRGKQYEYAGNA